MRKDHLSKKQRSVLMSAIKPKNTKFEVSYYADLKNYGLKFKKHLKTIRGTPDIVFPDKRICVFLESDFWHGWYYPVWKKSLPEYWQTKIERNRKRDKRTIGYLKRNGWIVLRIWEHQIKYNKQKTIMRLLNTLNNS